MWFEQAFNYLSGFNTASVILRILMAVLFGGLTGIDRTRKRRPAGFRTYSMVCLGATLTMLVGQYIYAQGIFSDPARIGAQVVSGVGFLGAGTIMFKSGRNQVKGLTTAAGLWASACLGLVIGVGFYLAAIAGLAAIIFIETLMNRFNEVLIRNASVVNVYLEISADKNLGRMITFLKGHDVHVTEIEPSGGKEGGIYSYFLVLRVSKHNKLSHFDIMQLISSSEGILLCEELN